MGGRGWRGWNTIDEGGWPNDHPDGIDAPCETKVVQPVYCSKCKGTTPQNAAVNGSCPKCGGPHFPEKKDK